MKVRSLLPVVLAVCFRGALLRAETPQVIPLWPGGAPGSETRRSEPEQAPDYWVKNIHNPSLTV